ncbi:hypothetical protein [Amycolatopsis methanolica]|uniref:Uncharacterized protein n=1 Tax=Amycolatopsis methanolica 239 TaxID=1068978 RepID=A0A076N407_AMYME|nr:hypothetical protein [Amycolatopsis methanolica]AIJ26016.1 hypothetical protein AMETH_5924 [Amycolatopsis methanolica 239]
MFIAQRIRLRTHIANSPDVVDHRLVPYRDRVARLLGSDGRAAGCLLLLTQVWYEASGPWWRRSWSAGAERLDWFAEVLTDGEWLHTDGGWMFTEDAVAELSSGSFDCYGREFAIAWLAGDEAAEVRRQFCV